jgi:methylated-DNA-[protein]-cysteine S-methyltransferase
MKGHQMIAYLDETGSPAGPVAFAVNEDGSLIRVSFRNGNYERTLEEELADDGYEIVRDRDVTAAVREQIDAYSRGELLTFDIPVAMKGTEWQQRVWRELMNIPFGETRSYGDIARIVCTIRASRAVGRANATNPIPLVVPCHRVVGADGSLTGFGGGLHLKKALLEHEERVLHTHPDAPAGTQRSLLPAG